MALTTPQLQALKADIAADPVLSVLPQTPANAWAIAVEYNKPAVPAFYIWRTSVSVAEIMGNGFDWSRVDNLTAGKARIWEWMTDLGTINPSATNVRQGIQACFSAAGDNAMRQAIYNHCAAPATRAQKLYSTGAGAAPSNDGIGPALTELTASLNYEDVLSAWAS